MKRAITYQYVDHLFPSKSRATYKDLSENGTEARETNTQEPHPEREDRESRIIFHGNQTSSDIDVRLCKKTNTISAGAGIRQTLLAHRWDVPFRPHPSRCHERRRRRRRYEPHGRQMELSRRTSRRATRKQTCAQHREGSPG